jgi:hypothetical protein
MWKNTSEFNPIKKLAIGESIEGVYKGTRQVKDVGSLFHSIETADGVIYDLYGNGALDHKLAFLDKDTKKLVPVLNEGEKIKILYNGKRTANVKIGGSKVKKDVHDFIVFIDE